MVKNDCTVRALSLALDVPYEDVASRLAVDGYRPGKGFHLDRWIACQVNPAIGEPENVFGFTAEWVRCPAVKGQPRHTPATFAAAHRRGAFVLRQARHAVAVKDGAVLMEPRRVSGGCVYGAWIFRRATPPMRER